MKEYLKLMITVYELNQADVITTSGGVPGDPDWKPSENETPFVPFE